MSGIDDASAPKRKFKAPYTQSHQIPTISGYRETQEQRREDAGVTPPADDRSYKQQARDAYADYKSRKEGGQPGHEDEHDGTKINGYDAHNTGDKEHEEARDPEDVTDEEAEGAQVEDTSQGPSFEADPKARRKQMKKRGGERAEREVTDPITHLPVQIHDFTNKELNEVPENEKPTRVTSDLDQTVNRSDQMLKEDKAELKRWHQGMQNRFPPPDFDMVKKRIATVHAYALGIGFGMFVISFSGLVLFDKAMGIGNHNILSNIYYLTFMAGFAGVIFYGVTGFASKKIEDVWEGEVWAAERDAGYNRLQKDEPETTQWLNSFLGSVWPLVNPDLFISLVDTLEDVMQASLPSLVRMVSVDDIGQGTEALRILGVKWLPQGAAAHNVTEDGKLEKKKKNEAGKSDRSVPGQGDVQNSKKDTDDSGKPGGSAKARKQRETDEQSNENIAEGLEAEEGDFVNMELAFAYRARVDGHGLKTRAKNAHLYMAFYMPGNIKLPVWVELRGIVGTVRLRLQLTPDPPFISLCTLSFMGQPKVDISCVPLFKKALNIMDLPIISNFVQSSVDAAMAEYVAPKSLTLDLKDMMMGDDFKKDTAARGILVVRIKRAFDFKEGDPGLSFIRSGNTDGYVSVGWAKFGKAVWSTRVILSEMNPYWEETAFLLVTPQELNVDERLRLQLWDSDRMTADDDLGRIELDVKDIMRDKRSNGNMWDRQDGFRALKVGEEMPGQLEWSVGYYSKTRILDSQIAKQKEEPGVNNMKELKEKTNAESERKLREAISSPDQEDSEVEQQKAQDLKAKQDQMIIAVPPPKEYPSGVLSIVIHQITGLELEPINKQHAQKHETDDDQHEQGDDLPSSFCTIIVNHQKAYKTRTKPKNAKPFFNAGCERFIRDYRTAQVHISVRDARVHENDALIGLVHLPLKEIFKNRSQVDQVYPLAGGVGYGRIRISMVFRAVQLQMPPQMTGWEYGTIDIKPIVKGNVAADIQGCKIRVRIKVAKGKLKPTNEDGQQVWKTKHDHPLRLAVRKRYSSCLVLEFRSSSASLLGAEKVIAYGVLWLKDIIDEEENVVKVPVYKGDLKRAEVNVLPESERGEHLGEVELNLTFWSGLSGYHLPLAANDQNLADVMEVLDAANDLDENDGVSSEAGGDSDSSDDENDYNASVKGGSVNGDDDIEQRKKKFKQDHQSTGETGKSDLEETGKRGPLDQLRDYSRHKDQLHRRNRGLMQWKAPRTVKWGVDKVHRVEQKISGLFHHHTRETGIETEV